MDHYPIFHDVYELLNFQSKLAFKLGTHFCKKNFHITNLLAVDDRYLRKIDKKVMVKYFLYTVSFRVLNKSMGNISYLRFLKKLDISNIQSIDQECLEKLSLVELKCNNVRCIGDLSFMTSLKVLHARGVPGLKKTSLQSLDLHELVFDNVYPFTNFSHMRNLKILHAYCHFSEFKIDSQNHPNLTDLRCHSECDIVGLSQLTGLKCLQLPSTYEPSIQTDLVGMDLVEFNANNIFAPIDLYFMRNLKILYAEYDSAIRQDNIMRLDLIELYANDNPRITNVTHMRNLRVLHAKGESGITDAGIAGLNLWVLNTGGNHKITIKK